MCPLEHACAETFRADQREMERGANQPRQGADREARGRERQQSPMVLFGYFLPRRLPINWHEGRPLQSRTG